MLSHRQRCILTFVPEFQYEYDIFECNYKRNNSHEKMNSFFNITVRKTLDVKFTIDFYNYFYLRS